MRHRHRAPREPSNRQPAPRPLRASGRPRRDAVLPLARGRPDAPVRRRAHGPHLRHDAEVRHARRHADPGKGRHQGRGERPAQGRAGQLRDAQERPRLRQRHEHPAAGHLRGAQQDPRRQGPDGARGRGHLRHRPARGLRLLPRGARPRRVGRSWPDQVARGAHGPQGRPSGGGRPGRGRRGGRRQRVRAQVLRREGREDRRGSDARLGVPGDASRHRHALDVVPAGDGLPQDRHRTARIWPARPARRVQERGVRRLQRAGQHHVRGLPSHDSAHRGCRAPARRLRRGAERAARRPLLRSLRGRRRPGPAPAAKPTTYRKADDPDPYAGVGRNDPCPCKSGKKFKKCHGRNR